ncbi:hypothetical protein L3Q82_022947, partial [Scortum barcoo]
MHISVAIILTVLVEQATKQGLDLDTLLKMQLMESHKDPVLTKQEMLTSATMAFLRKLIVVRLMHISVAIILTVLVEQATKQGLDLDTLLKMQLMESHKDPGVDKAGD